MDFLFTKLLNYFSPFQLFQQCTSLLSLYKNGTLELIETDKKKKSMYIILPSTFEVRQTICSHPCDVCNIQWSPLLPSLLPGPGNSITQKRKKDKRKKERKKDEKKIPVYRSYIYRSIQKTKPIILL